MLRIKLTLTLLIIVLLSILTMFSLPVSAAPQSADQQTPQTTPCGGGSILSFPHWFEYLNCDADGSPYFKDSDGKYSLNVFVLILMAIIDMGLRLGGILAVIFIIVGGIKYTTSQGNPEGVQNAKNTIMYSVIGLVLTMVATGIVSFIARSIPT